jgi:hypothetical protein
MSNTNDDTSEHDLKSLGRGVRGKYVGRGPKSVNVVTIDDDLVDAFPNAKAVNDALRSLVESRRTTKESRD